METTLVVMERGSGWPARVHLSGLDLVALRQELEEPGDAFLARTFKRVHAIQAKGGAIRHAVLSCNDDASRASLEVRTLLAQILLAGLDGDGARLLLLAEPAVGRVTEGVAIDFAWPHA